jgi:hypothetical protein
VSVGNSCVCGSGVAEARGVGAMPGVDTGRTVTLGSGFGGIGKDGSGVGAAGGTAER